MKERDKEIEEKEIGEKRKLKKKKICGKIVSLFK